MEKEQCVVEAEENLANEKKRLKDLQWNTMAESLDQEIMAFWEVQKLPVLDRSQYPSDEKMRIAKDKQKKSYLIDHMDKLDFSAFPLLKFYFTNKKNQLSQLSELEYFLMSEFVEPNDLNALSTASSVSDKSLEDTLLEARAKGLLPEIYYQLAKSWVVVKEAALNITLLTFVKAPVCKDYSYVESELILKNKEVLHTGVLKTVESLLVYCLNKLARVHTLPLRSQLQVRNPPVAQVGQCYLQYLPQNVQDDLGTPIKIVHKGASIIIDYRLKEFFIGNLDENIQAQFIMPNDRADHQLVLKLKPDRSGVESANVIFTGEDVSILPASLRKQIQISKIPVAAAMPVAAITPVVASPFVVVTEMGEDFFLTLKKLLDEKKPFNENSLRATIREYLENHEPKSLFNQGLNNGLVNFGDPCFRMNEGRTQAQVQARRIAAIVYEETKLCLSKIPSSNDSRKESLAVTLLISRRYLEKTAKWYQWVPSKAKTLALIEQKIPSLKMGAIPNNDLGNHLVIENDLINRHEIFWNKSFKKGLTQQGFQQLLANRINALAAKELRVRFNAQYSLSCLLTDARTIMLSGKEVSVKEAVLSHLLAKPLSQQERIKKVLVAKLECCCLEGRLTPEGWWLLEALLKHDQSFTLFSNMLKDASPALMQVIKNTILESHLNIHDHEKMLTSCDALIKFRRHYEKAKNQPVINPHNFNLHFDYPDIMIDMGQQFMPTLLTLAKDARSYQRFITQLSLEQKQEYFNCIDEFLSIVTSSLENFLNYMMQLTEKQSYADKLNLLSVLCSLDVNLASRLEVRMESMVEKLKEKEFLLRQPSAETGIEPELILPSPALACDLMPMIATSSQACDVSLSSNCPSAEVSETLSLPRSVSASPMDPHKVTTLRPLETLTDVLKTLGDFLAKNKSSMVLVNFPARPNTCMQLSC